MTNNKETKELKLWAKSWIDANVHDGEDRAGCTGDSSYFTPDDLQELIDDLLDDLATRTNTDLQTKLDEVQAQNRALGEALESIKSAWTSLPEGNHSIAVISKWLKAEMVVGMGVVRQALASTDTERYKLEQAVLDAAIEWNTIDGDNDSERMVIKLEQAVTAMQEHNNAGEES